MRFRQSIGLTFVALTALCLMPALSRAVDVDKYLPDNTQFVISVNVKQILHSELFKKYGAPAAHQQLDNNHEAQKLLDVLGLNPFKDLAQVTFAGPEAEKAKDDVTTIVHGDFNPTKIYQAADAFATSNPEKLKIEKKGEMPIYEFRQNDKATGYGALLGNHIMVLASKKSRVLDALAVHDGTRTPKVNGALRDLVRKVSGKESVWVAALMTDQLKKQFKGHNQQQQFLSELDAVNGGLTVTEVIKFNLDAHMGTAEAAEQLTNTLRFIVPFAVGGVTNQPQFKPFAPTINQVVKAIHFNSAGKTASVDLTLDKELINKLTDAVQNAGSTPPPNPDK